MSTSKIISWVVGITLGISLSMFGSALVANDNKENNRIPLHDVQRFSTAISQIKSYYVKDVKDKELFEDAIRGMLAGLDPHSAYLDEEDFRELTSTTQGEFGGLGIEVTMDRGFLKVIAPIDDTPAKKAGIKAGDYIVRINGRALKEMTLREAVTIMRGKKGSAITLTILRKGEDKPLEITMKRDIIKIKTVKSRLLDTKYGYIRVSHFQAPTVTNLKKALVKLQKDAGGKLSGLVLDLRDNPGGLLDSAVEMSDLFINGAKEKNRKMIVFTKGRLHGSNLKAYATPGDKLNNAPIVVLINGGSASGSEIVAGALKDNKRAIIMGEKSFGKGSVQTILPLGTNRGIKLTTALYFTPNGVSIQAKGISPDINVAELKVPVPSKEDKKNYRLSEADLSGHLANGNKSKASAKPKAGQLPGKNSAELVHTDYQLYEAVNLLKGLAFTRR